MHSKQKGTIGEALIIAEFLKEGFHVFTEFGDLSRIDLIVERNNTLLKIQVKACTSRNSIVEVYRGKSGPNYRYKYSKNDVDIFAVFILDRQKVFFVDSSELCSVERSLAFRIDNSRRRNKNARYIKDYTLNRILRDFTPNILTDYAEDDEKVQTTTDFLASES